MQSLCVSRVTLPEGRIWHLGKPFRVELELQNSSARNIVIWRPNSPDGSSLAWLELRDKSGHMTKLEWEAVPRFGLGSPMPLVAKGTAKYELDVAKSTGWKKLRAGHYSVTGHYRNTNGESHVWTGEIASQPIGMEIAK